MSRGSISTFELKIPTISETNKAIMRLIDRSEGPDYISSTMLKIACSDKEFLKIVHYIFCISIITNKFAKVWKESRITPLHKGSYKSPKLVENYRPISGVSYLAKQ